jgi:hypothetical protein
LVVTFPLLLLIALLIPLAGCSAAKVAQEAAEPRSKPEKPPVNPLTGEKVTSWELVTRRPLAVKVENDPRARPQSGIVDADLVYEQLVEGGVTRFICIYLSRDSQAIGPTRSARPSDIDIVYFLDPLLICSGGSTAVISMVQASGLLYITEDATHFWRERSRRAPHNLYTSTALLRQFLAESGDAFDRPPDAGLHFATENSAATQGEAGAGGGEPENTGGTGSESVMVSEATALDIAYKAAICAASYRYDPSSRAYLHFIQGSPHTDGSTGRQVAPRNVIVQYVAVTDSGLRDGTGASVPEYRVTGSGKCLVFTGGKVYHGTWRKDNRKSPTVFTDENGKPILLNPGQTWIHLINEEIAVTYQ